MIPLPPSHSPLSLSLSLLQFCKKKHLFCLFVHLLLNFCQLLTFFSTCSSLPVICWQLKNCSAKETQNSLYAFSGKAFCPPSVEKPISLSLKTVVQVVSAAPKGCGIDPRRSAAFHTVGSRKKVQEGGCGRRVFFVHYPLVQGITVVFACMLGHQH